MRTRSELERLAAAGRPLLTRAESLVDAGEEDRILERILASSRAPARSRPNLTLRTALLLAGAVFLVAAAAVVATGVFARSRPPAGDQQVALKGAKLQLAGYHFRTPAGFKASSGACAAGAAPGQPRTVFNGFAAAASADGGCVEAAVMISSSGSAVPPGATPVDVGAYQGYIVSAATQNTTLYVVLPALGGQINWQALVLESEGLSQDQLVAIAESGLPQNPAAGATVGPT